MSLKHAKLRISGRCDLFAEDGLKKFCEANDCNDHRDIKNALEVSSQKLNSVVGTAGNFYKANYEEINKLRKRLVFAP